MAIRKYIGKALGTIAGLSLLAISGCGGGSSAKGPPQIYIPVERISSSGVLGVRPGTGVMLITNTGRSDLTITVVLEPWMMANGNLTSGTITPGFSLTLGFQFQCETPGERRGVIRVNSNDRTLPTADVDVVLVCAAPPVDLAVLEAVAVTGTVGSVATGSIRWHFTTPWDGQPAIGYTVFADDMGVSVADNVGNLTPDTELTNSLEYTCSDEEDRTIGIRIEAGTEATGQELALTCTASTASNVAVDIYQGPLAMRWQFPDGAEAENERYLALLENRKTIFVVQLTGPIEDIPQLTVRRFVDGVEVAPLELVDQPVVLQQKDGSYLTSYPIELGRGQLTNGTLVEFQLHNQAPFVVDFADIELHPDKATKVTFLFEDPELARMDFDTDELLAGLYNVFPLSSFEAEFEVLGGDGLTDYRLGEVLDRWLAAGDENEVFIGLVRKLDDGLCGRAIVGNTASLISIDDRQCEPKDALVHQMYHNFGLGHDIEVSAKTVMPAEPRTDAGTGELLWDFDAGQLVELDTSKAIDDEFEHFVGLSRSQFERVLSQRDGIAVGAETDVRTEGSTTLFVRGNIDEAGKWVGVTHIISTRSLAIEHSVSSEIEEFKLFDKHGDVLAFGSVEWLEEAHGEIRHWTVQVPNGARTEMPKEGFVEIIDSEDNVLHTEIIWN